MKITFNARNVEPGTHWIHPGHVIAALLMLAFLTLFVYALATS
jgi:hypothetical protein